MQLLITKPEVEKLKEHAIQRDVMNTNAFILCAGNHARWTGDTPKQFSKIGGETLIQRIERQFAPVSPVTVCTSLLTFVSANSVLSLPKTECACDTILQVLPKAEMRVIFLLGDVFYTDHCADQIMGCHESPGFFTDGCDIFAMVFIAKDFSKVAEACAIGMVNNRERKTDGKCWEIFRHFNPAVRHWPLDPADPAILHARFVTDETQDFDLVEDWEAFKAGKSKNHLHK